MLRQDIYTHNWAVALAAFFRSIFLCVGKKKKRSTTGGATANSRVAPFLLGAI